MKRWFIAVIFGSLGKMFNDPNFAMRLEERLANSAPLRQIARTMAAIIQRGSWEIKNITRLLPDQVLKIKSPEDAIRKLKDIENEMKRRMDGKL